MQPSEHKSSTGDFFPVMDGIRGLAVLSVVVYHLAYFNPASPVQKVFSSIAKAGFIGVPIFFVLSGFLISLTVIKSQNRFSVRSYLLHRGAKIFPPFLISLLLFSLLSLQWKDTHNLWGSAVAYVFTVPNFTSGWDEINPVYWSLMVEMHFYLVFPLLFFLAKRFSRCPELWCAGILLVIPATIRLLGHLPIDVHTDTWHPHAQIFPRALDNFALGIIFSHIYVNRSKYDWIISRSAGIAYFGIFILVSSYLCSAGVNYFLPFESPYNDPDRIWKFELFRYLPAAGTFLSLFCIFMKENALISRLLMFAPLQFAGVISYEWFLFHYPPALYLSHVIGQTDGNMMLYLGRTLLPFVLTFIFSALLFHFVSNPIMNWAKKIKFQ